ncbi:protein SUPPRESSOR OF MAX2 1-like [Salvia miltiorrhiza]|uniref:protein SUPPRESSOR OF MAX2 1-like n=1 Tax=Salvia miltiorrhiza TaxID=226208 RepID=UPI0025ABBDEC|nr:protein SUPPRESSOR OF MAX2 1-like [Salvia miltiorrhiza]
MRAGLSTIQQTLTPEASAILSQSIAEARRRNHGQTTPLHVAAALLSSPSGYLRQACIRSHPNSSHPLQCRALELCFSVALERLPTAQKAAAEPPISNALMAALKRAQAHQRRGCPEQQQQPLLAVKVELDQLIVSILDDPSVSRVMREASFSSPAVKSAVEHSSAAASLNYAPPALFANPPPLSHNRNAYLNPRLQPPPPEAAKVVEIMRRSKKRNPILVGDSEPAAVVRDLLRKVESHDEIFKSVSVVSMEKGISMEELGGLIEGRVRSGGVILDLGDLRWVVEQQAAAEAVAEMAKLVARFRGDGSKLWLIGTATCETYLRCQVYHSTMENDWDLQPLPMALRSTPFPRFGGERFLSIPVEGVPPVGRRVSESSDPSERAPCCPRCSENYDKEAAKLRTLHSSFSEASPEASLPLWLQNAKLNTNQSKQRIQELHKKWRDICLHLHPNFHHNSHPCRPLPPTLSTASLHSRNLLTRPRSHLPLPGQLSTDQPTHSPPGSPVRTELVLGRKGAVCEDQARDLLGCVSSQPRAKLLDKFASPLDADTYKKLLKGLMERAWWQAEAASTVASAIACCKSGNGRRRGAASRGDIWLLFTGPDRAGKKKMASVIAEQICGYTPIMMCLGTRRDDEEPEANFRGRTAVDRVAEVVRRNPFSVIVLQDIDEADALVLGSIKRAVERGRIADSHGREVGLGNAVFILTGDWSATSAEALRDGRFVDEKKLAAVAGGGWRLGLVVREKTGKRRASWLGGDDGDGRPLKPHREAAPCGLSLDLNLAAGDVEDDRTDGSHNSSDLTIDHEEELSQVSHHCSVTSVPQDLLNNVDESVVFKAVDSAFARTEIKKAIATKFSMTVDENLSLEIEDDVLDKILGGLWHDRTSLQEWIEKVLEPSFDRLKPRVPSAGVVRLVAESDSGSRGRGRNGGDWLPSSILV